MASQNGNIFSTKLPSGTVFVGCMFIGIGLGVLKKEAGAYTLIGMGVGFVLTALITVFSSKNTLKR